MDRLQCLWFVHGLLYPLSKKATVRQTEAAIQRVGSAWGRFKGCAHNVWACYYPEKESSAQEVTVIFSPCLC